MDDWAAPVFAMLSLFFGAGLYSFAQTVIWIADDMGLNNHGVNYYYVWVNVLSVCLMEIVCYYAFAVVGPIAFPLAK
jgi:hypothetical protein